MGSSLSGKFALILVMAELRMVSLAGQADVLVVAGGSSAATLIDFAAYWWKGFS